MSILRELAHDLVPAAPPALRKWLRRAIPLLQARDKPGVAGLRARLPRDRERGRQPRAGEQDVHGARSPRGHEPVGALTAGSPEHRAPLKDDTGEPLVKRTYYPLWVPP